MQFPGRICVVVVCAGMGVVHAQEFRGTFSGSVTDRTGAAIGKAKVTATSVYTAVHTATLTEASGAYTIPFLPPGEYTIRAEDAGFKSAVRQGLTIPHPN